ncbi:MAG: hypothetical protein KA788_00735 [Lacunisphaera sp.]|mgnify:CR=1 FL=1|jgi:hypothetical protein|nr:hypothetical protein [Lacunisphaera sp.]
MNKYHLLVGALVLLIGAYTIGFFARFNPSATVQPVAPATSKTEAPGGSVPFPANPRSLATPVGQNADRVETVRRDVKPVSEGFAVLTKAERIRQITAEMDRTYKKTITGLGLSPANQEKLRSFLIDRALTRWDAHDIATAAVPPDQDSLNRALDVADAVSDDEATKVFGPEVLDKIRSMIEARPYIARISQHFDPAMTQARVPLTPEQMLPLAEVFFHTFGSANNPQIEVNRRHVNPITGLTPLDLLVLERAKTVLTQAQLEVLRQKTVALNRAYYLGKS